MQRQNMWQSWEDRLKIVGKFESGCVFWKIVLAWVGALGTASCGGFFLDLMMIVRFSV